ncbi:MAG: hypothetical protein JNN05_07685, partial [Candidatus Omnitrophica bacterium]|nr:hypothetical protein [Candidatus Omnitrophota bacterium]
MIKESKHESPILMTFKTLFVFVFLLNICVLPLAAFAERDLPSLSHSAAQVDPQSGSASFGVPIEIPSGRAGLQPNINLQYNSRLRNGPLGVGWVFEMGAIQRSTKKGVPTYN